MPRIESDKPFIRMSVAVDRQSPDGEKQTAWYQVILNSPTMLRDPEKVLAFYTSGKRVLVEGDLRLRPYLDKSGTPSVERSVFPITRPQLL